MTNETTIITDKESFLCDWCYKLKPNRHKSSHIMAGKPVCKVCHMLFDVLDIGINV